MPGQGNKIVATDYNTIQAKINLVLGVGTGNFGYGQTVTSGQVSLENKIEASQWNAVRNDLLKARQHQTGLNESGNLALPTTSATIKEADRAAYNNFADVISTNKLVTPPPSQGTLATLSTIVRTTPWNSTASQTITCTFSSVDAARHFFNSGSNLKFSASFTDYTTDGSLLVNQSWATLLANMGIISFAAESTTNTGTGTAQNIGYYNLTATTNQLVFSKSVEASNPSYYPNQYDLYARLGPTANIVVFIPTFSYTGGPVGPGTGVVPEPANGSLTSILQTYYATGSNVAVVPPTVVADAITGGVPVPPAPVISYAVTPTALSVNEGSSAVFNVTGTNIPNGTYYWTTASFTAGSSDFLLASGDAIFTTPGSHSWTCPAGVTSVSIVAIGAGGSGGSARLTGGTGGSGGGGGGALAYLNSYSVTPGQVYTVVVGLGGELVTAYPARNGGATYLSYLGSDVIRANGGIGGQLYTVGTQTNPSPAGGTFSGISGTVGQNGGTGGLPSPAGGGGGGGAGSYQFTAGAGLSFSGSGAFPIPGGSGSTTNAGTQGGRAGFVSPSGSVDLPAAAGGGGGGTGLFGSKDYSISSVGSSTGTDSGGTGGTYGGGGGGNGVGRDEGGGALSGYGGRGANGALRIVYGSQRTFPSTDVGTSASEFGASGSFTITSNAGSFSIPVVADLLTEGAESFYVTIRTGSVTGPEVANSTTSLVTISDTSTTPPPPTLAISPTTLTYSSVVNIAPNTQRITFTSTNGAVDVETVATVGATSNSVVTIDYTGATGSVSTGAPFTVNGTKYIDVRYYLSSGTSGSATLSMSTSAGSKAATLNWTVVPSYAISPAASSVNEGSSLTFTVTTTSVVNGTVLNWAINTNTGDFATSTGTVTINSNTGTFTVTPTADGIVESAETFSVSIYTGSISGTPVVTSSSITINDSAIYTLTPAANNVSEGSSLTFTVSGSNIPNGTYYWSVPSTGDFGTTSGSFTITSNSGSFSVSPTADSSSEGSETFIASIWSGSAGGTLLTTSSPVTINDTSTTPPPPPPPPPPPAPTIPGITLTVIDWYKGTPPFTNYGQKALYLSNSSGVTVSYQFITTGLDYDAVSSTNPMSGTLPNALGAYAAFRGPHGSATGLVVVNAPGYSTTSASVSIPANSKYAPYDWYNGFSQEFGRPPGSQLNLAYGIGAGIYASNSQFFVDYNDGIGTRIRYGFFRAPEAGGVQFWTSYAIANGFNWDTPAFINLIIQSGEINNERVQTNAKPYLPGTGYNTFLDRP